MPENKTRHASWTPVTLSVVLGIIVVVVILNVIGDPLERLRTAEPENINAFLEEFAIDIPALEESFRPQLSVDALRGFDAGIISRDNDPLRTRLSKPAGAGPFTTVIIVHDAPSSEPVTDRIDLELAQPLVDAASVVTFTVDWRSYDGDRAGQLRDVLSVVDWIEKLATSDTAPVVLIGIGYGAGLVVDVAQQHTVVDGLVLVDVPESNDRTAITNIGAIIPVVEWNTAHDGALTRINETGVAVVAERLVSWLNTTIQIERTVTLPEL